MLALFAVQEGLQVQFVRIANFVRRYDPRTHWPMRVEGFSKRHRRRSALPVAHADVVYDYVAGDYLVSASGGHMTASSSDHKSQLAFVVERPRRPPQMNRVSPSRPAARFLV